MGGFRADGRGAAGLVFFKCPHCGVTQMRQGDVCAFCGKPAPESEVPAKESPLTPSAAAPSQTPEPVALGKRFCSACGAKAGAGMRFCEQCGVEL